MTYIIRDHNGEPIGNSPILALANEIADALGGYVTTDENDAEKEAA